MDIDAPLGAWQFVFTVDRELSNGNRECADEL